MEENFTKYALSTDAYVKKEDKIERVNDEKDGKQAENARPITENEKRDLQFVRV